MRRAAKRDANEGDIIDALQAIGVRVQQLSQGGVPDLLCGTNGRLWLVEVKVPGEQLTTQQKAWHREWSGLPVHIAYSVADAIAIAARYMGRS